ncbi:MAG: hypothetical protein RML36_01740 [Anaerolineae bacterium]|nr:hypothetical protein [Anaerolineae bacterium]MDW8098189.1 hypothetical protein [Anaerolineae bacterium]
MERKTDSRWIKLGPIYPGGTVMALAAHSGPDGDVFLAATQTGIFRSEDGGRTWNAANEGLPTLQISALAFAPNGTAFAGGLTGGVAISANCGRTWYTSRSAGLEQAVTTIAPSPRYAEDATVLVGTDGGGVMRSADRGHHWTPANFRLGDLHVLALACAPAWGDHEELFAATVDGVYRSTNGGRAWRGAGQGLEGKVVQALAVSPNFSQDRTLFAGTESDGVFRSTDAGFSWAPSGAGTEGLTINCLWISPDFAQDRTILAGTSVGILCSTDGGDTWRMAYQSGDPVLALAGSRAAVCAGTMEQGILRSSDGGRTWHVSNEGLAARAFLRTLTVAGHPGLILAFGPQEGIVLSADRSGNWQRVPGLSEYLPLSAVAAANQGVHRPPLLVVSTAEGHILRSADAGVTWTPCAVGIPATTLVFDRSGQRVWAATADGYLFVSRNGGVSWEGLPRPPFAGESVLSVVPSPFVDEDHTLLAGSLAQGNTKARLWRSLDDGRSWELVSEAPTEVPWLALVAPPVRSRRPYDRAILGAGRSCIVSTGQQRDTWKIVPVGDKGASVLSLAVDGLSRTVYAGTNLGLYHSQDTGRTWHLVSGPLEGQPILDLQVDEADRSLLMLVPGGTLWRYRIR